MTSSPFYPDDEALRCLVEALTESGQAVSIFDAEDNLRYANKTYQGMFLGDYDGPFTFTGITRHAHRNGLGVRIDDGDVEAFLARTWPGDGVRLVSRSRPILWMAAGSGSIIRSYRAAGSCPWALTSQH